MLEQFSRSYIKPSKIGDTSYLQAIADQVDAAAESRDLAKLLEYSITLSRAIYEEKLRREPKPSQKLSNLKFYRWPSN